MTKKLIIAPHVDDDVLGCGGILDKNCLVIYCGLDETGIDNRPSKDERIDEIFSVKKITNHNHTILNNLVNRYLMKFMYVTHLTIKIIKLFTMQLW